MQKWGVREHLDDGEPLLAGHHAVGGVHRVHPRPPAGLPSPGHEHSATSVTARKIWRAILRPADRSAGADDLVALLRAGLHPRHGHRQDAAGTASPTRALRSALARLLGAAAAPNMIVGRCDAHGNVLFDDGDEVVVEDAHGLPVEIVVAGLMGTFHDFRNDLHHFAAVYAGPVNRRLEHLANPEEFARVYLDAFVERFLAIQEKYRSRRGPSTRCSSTAPTTRRQLRLSLGTSARPVGPGRSPRAGRAGAGSSALAGRVLSYFSSGVSAAMAAASSGLSRRRRIFRSRPSVM